MEIKKEILSGSKVKLTIKVTSLEMRSFFSRVYNQLASKVEVKGFRKGMAPKALTIAAIGENRLNAEIIEQAIQETYPEAIKKEKILPVVSPNANIKMVKDLTTDTAELEYEVEVEFLPEIKIGDYRKIKVSSPHEKIQATVDETNRVLSHLQRQHAQFKDIDRPLKDGDRAEINFEGFEKRVKLENLSSNNYPVILGSKVLIGEFEKQLIGLRKGEKKEFTLELAGQKEARQDRAISKLKKINFKVEILTAQEVILPKLDDQLAQKFSRKTLSDLKEAITKDIISQKKTAEEKKIENQVLEKLAGMIKVEIPESLISKEVEKEIEEFKTKVSAAGMTFEKYLENLKKTEDDFKKELREPAKKTIKIGLALGEVIRKEKINPQDKEATRLALKKLVDMATRKRPENG